MITIKIGGYNGYNNEPFNLAERKYEREKISSSKKMIQESYKSYDKNVNNSSVEEINKKISLLEDTVKRHLDELMNILQQQYEFVVTTSIHDKSKIVVQLLDYKTKEIKKEIPAESFLKMANYIEEIFYIEK